MGEGSTISGKRVLVRADFNVPIDGSGRVVDDSRIRAALPTIEYLRARGAATILMSHLGRPAGSVVESLRMHRVAGVLSKLLGVDVTVADDCIGPGVAKAVAAMKPGGVLMLENLRFHAGETKNDVDFARSLAEPAELYVNDAFGVSHRAHASVSAIARLLPARSGLLVTEEMKVLSAAITSPQRPLVVLIGGAKVHDKVPVLEGLLGVADTVLVGGAIANTFLAALGHEMGASLVEKDAVPLAARLIARARDADLNMLFPTDVVLAQFLTADSPRDTAPVERVPPGWQAVDIGPRTTERFSEQLAQAGTIIWNGPMGVYEVGPFARGTRAMAAAVAAAGATSIIGGGDSVAVIRDMDLSDRVQHISTGGGAMLALLAGKEMPGLHGLEPLQEYDL